MEEIKQDKAITSEPAIYINQDLEEYSGNPFIEALPKINTEKQVLEKFYNIPIFSDDIREKSSDIRYHMLKRIKEYTQVLPEHIALEKKLSTMIRRGYLDRNPVMTNYFGKLRILSDLREANVSTDDIDYNYKKKFMNSTADCLTILGISGVGKTTAIEKLLTMYPQVISHHMYNDKKITRTQIVWLKVDCPYDGSLSTLCKSFFKAVDDVLIETRYLDKYGYSSRVTSTLMLDMTRVASLHGIGVLVIDEIQNLINSKNSTHEMLNFFVTLSNTIGIPTVLIGTPKAKELFEGNFRQARRASSEGYLVWDRMNIDSKSWKVFIKTLWSMQCLKEYTELTDSLQKLFYSETLGITSVAVNLFILIQEKALIEHKEKITEKLIKDTAKKDLKLLQPMLKALRENNLRDIQQYDDISLNFNAISNKNYIEYNLSSKLNEMYENRKLDIENIQNNRAKELVVELKLLNIFSNLTDDVLKDIINDEIKLNHKDISYETLKGLCIIKAINKNEQNGQLKSKNKRNKNSEESNNEKLLPLLNMHKKAKKEEKHTYDILKENGFIKDPRVEFKL